MLNHEPMGKGIPEKKRPAQAQHARVAELVDALDLGSSPERGEGSSPSSRIGFSG